MMYQIKCTEDARLAYVMLGFLKQKRDQVDDRTLCDERIMELKKEIRKYSRRPCSEERLVEDSGINGYTVVLPLPASLDSKEEAERYFCRNEYIEQTYSAYDCTGRPFTLWYKVFRRLGRFWAYHCVRYDV